MSGTAINRLADLRLQRSWHRTVVGAVCNVGEKTVYRWETEETPVPSPVIPTLAALFNVTPEHLMGWDRQPVETGKAA